MVTKHWLVKQQRRMQLKQIKTRLFFNNVGQTYGNRTCIFSFRFEWTRSTSTLIVLDHVLLEIFSAIDYSYLAGERLRKQKTEKSEGVCSLAQLLIADLEKEATVAEVEGKNSQATYGRAP